jgi:glycosyltransferase involved in cell wall biosynthesis
LDERAKPKVSVIIPAYNAEKTIEQTLRSAMRQTYPNLEIIVVNDGSTDRTAWIAEQVACGDERVIILDQENSGVAAARNRGIAHSNGEFIAPLDADDIWHPTKTERQLGIFEQAADSVGLVYCYLRHIDAQNKITYSPAPICWRGDVYALL